MQGSPFNYKYNGKELQETGMYDFGARFYMPDIGRWGVVDPKSEYTKETYSYVWNNPINFFDLTGMEGEAASSDSSETGSSSGSEAGGSGSRGGDPPIRTQTIKEVVIVKPIPIKHGSSASFNIGGISGNPSSKQLFVPAIPIAYEVIALAISAIAAWDIADKAKNVEFQSFFLPNKEEIEDIRETDIEGVVISKPPRAKDDSGYKLPQDVLGGNRVNFAQRGWNNGKADNIEQLKAKKEAGTITKKERQILKRHEKNTSERPSRQSKDKKK